jgi:hypothetical protein
MSESMIAVLLIHSGGDSFLLLGQFVLKLFIMLSLVSGHHLSEYIGLSLKKSVVAYAIACEIVSPFLLMKLSTYDL